VEDGVILANPARVVALVTIIRHHMLQIHTLKLSSTEREGKTAKLYAYITSARCEQLFSRIDTQAEELLDLQVKEMKWHKNNWEKQGEAFRSIQKAKADLAHEIGSIIGTSAIDDQLLTEELTP
jgi:hypothetical protein